MMSNFSSIAKLLNQLGVTANYIGFFHASYAVCVALQSPEQLGVITKIIYPSVAKYYKTTWSSVERNIRTVAMVAWKTNRPMLEKLAHHSLPKKPGNAQFLSILMAQLTPFE